MSIINSFSSEIYRKLIHLSSIWIPLCYIYTSQQQVVYVLLPSTLFCYMVDKLRHKVRLIEVIYHYFFSKILREHELDKKNKCLTGATFLFFSSLITISIFEKKIAIFSLFILILADTSAALVGKYIGKGVDRKKTMVGTLAFLFTALIISLVSQYFYGNNWFLRSIPSIVAASIFEFYAPKIRIDDNFSIPLSSGFLFTIVQFLFK